MIKIVVTGASGFIGRKVLQSLASCQHVEVVPVTRRDIPGWYKVSDYAQSPSGDVLIHLAEDCDRGRVGELGTAYEEDVLATLNSLLIKNYRRIVYASSATLYGDEEPAAHSVTDQLKITDTYSRVKRLSEIAVLNSPGGVVVRLANIYGDGMSRKNVMSAILGQIPGSGPLVVLDSTPERDFLNVEDAAEGIVTLALGALQQGGAAKIFNLGTGVGTSIGALASMALEVANQTDRPVQSTYPSSKKSILILDYSDTTLACGWKPKTSLRQGLVNLMQQREEN